ncbi:MAG: NAD(P)H-dependent oxidoreductase [Acidobacteriota bacterium]
MKETITAQLNWRYATKAYDKSKKISAADWAVLEQSLIAAPSSFGLQPFKFIVVTDSAVRERLRAAAWNQSQVTDASHLVVFAFKKNLNDSDVDRFINHTASVRGIDASMLADYAGMIKGSIASKSASDIAVWNSRQAYIALGFLLSAAALLNIDATPMEGFDPAQFNEILGLEDYSAVVIAAVGYRDAANDYLAGLPKVRFSKDDLIQTV